MKNKEIIKAIIHRFHKEPSYYAEYSLYSAGNFFQNKYFMIYTHTFAEVLSSLFASAVCNFSDFLTLYEIISFMSAVLGTTADCIFSKVKILFLNFLKKLHDLNKIMQDAMLHILSDALRLLKYARCREHKYLHSSNYCYSGQLLKSEVE